MNGLESLFGSHSGVSDDIPFSMSPSIADYDEMQKAINAGKTLKLKSYHVKTFDMSSESDRNDYASIMSDLYNKVQARTCVIWVNDRQILSRTDHSTGWFRYLEWSDYENPDAQDSDTLTDSVPPKVAPASAGQNDEVDDYLDSEEIQHEG